MTMVQVGRLQSEEKGLKSELLDMEAKVSQSHGYISKHFMILLYLCKIIRVDLRMCKYHGLHQNERTTFNKVDTKGIR